MDRSIREMLEADETELTLRLADVEKILQRRYGKSGTLKGAKPDLAVLQRALDDRVKDLMRPAGIQNMGLAVGNVLANELGLRWVMAEDEYGSDPALQNPGDGAVFFPELLMESIEDGEKVDLSDLFRRFQRDLHRAVAS